MPAEAKEIDVLVVGAGPAGLGTALALGAVDGLVVGVMERGRVGQTFRDWPEGQRFLTPSFTTNGFGATDLNAIHPETSPAFSLGADYLSGPEYVRYLEGVVRHFRIPLLTSAEVLGIRAEDGGGFAVQSSLGPLRARAIVWAGGEFHDPLPGRFSGSGFTDHSSTAAAWEPRRGELVVVGGYESGVELACHQVEQGATVTVVDPSHPWDAGSGSDPSYNLAPRTRRRLARARDSGRLTLIGDGPVTAVKPDGDDGFLVSAAGRRLRSASRPLLAAGYGPGLGPAAELFSRRGDGWPELTDDDESTITPGLFLSGPAVRHGGIRFCFVYKFRQRYAHVARVIGERLGKECGQLERWRIAGMLTDDLSCCGVECSC